MKHPECNPELLQALETLSQRPDTPARVRGLAEQIRSRIMRPVTLAVVGPRAETIRSFLAAHNFDSVTDHGPEAVAFLQSSDLPVWCSDRAPSRDDTWRAIDADLMTRCVYVHVHDQPGQSRPYPQRGEAEGVDLHYIRGDYASETHLLTYLADRITVGRATDIENANILIDQFPQSRGTAVRGISLAPNPENPQPDALRFLADTADRLAQTGVSDLPTLLRQCSEAAETLTSLLEASHEPNLVEAARKGADQIQLMELEGDLASAIDSVTCLLQLQRDVSQRCAA